jgi:hypothetical protein
MVDYSSYSFFKINIIYFVMSLIYYLRNLKYDL